MKLFLRFSVLFWCFLIGIARGEDAFPEGKYREPFEADAGRFLEFSKGLFTCTYFTDAGGRAPAQKGVYQLHGSRVYLIGDNPDFGEVLFFQTIDGVSVLLNYQNLMMYRAQNKFTRFNGECYVLFCPSGEPDPDFGAWLKALRLKHPRFAQLVEKSLR